MENKVQETISFLKENGFDSNTEKLVQHSIGRISINGMFITFYKSGKALIQGKLIDNVDDIKGLLRYFDWKVK